MSAIDELPAQITTESALVQEWSDGTGPDSVWVLRRNQAQILWNQRNASSELDWAITTHLDLFNLLVDPDEEDVRAKALSLAARLCLWVDQIDARAE